MKLKKIVFAFATFALLFSAVPQISNAQTSIGASYEIREESPKHGFGFRIERDILKKAPIINLAIRAHFSYFSEDNRITRDTLTYSRDIKNYDYGLAAVGGVTVGPISPYVGVGLGASTLDVSRSDIPNDGPLEENSNDSAIYWNGFVGAKLSALPIKPFIEYRLQNVSDYKQELSDIQNSNGRMIFGVSISF